MRQKGFTLVEVMVAIGLIMILSVGLISTNQLAGAGLGLSQTRAETGRLAREGMEAVMSIRANNFSDLSVGTFHPVYDGSRWSLVSGEEILGVATRRVLISAVSRSLACVSVVCPVVDGGGFVDDDSLWVRVEVDWMESGDTKQVSMESLITFWR